MGRKFGDEARTHAPGSREERDELLEARYSYDRRSERSTLAFVSVYQQELVTEFFEWRRLHPGGEMWPALRQWQVERFGAELHQAAHGLLKFVIREALAPGEGGHRRAAHMPAAPIQGGLPGLDAAAGRLAREKDMGPDPQKERERRERLLQEQRREIEAEERNSRPSSVLAVSPIVADCGEPPFEPPDPSDDADTDRGGEGHL